MSEDKNKQASSTDNVPEEAIEELSNNEGGPEGEG